MSEPRRVLWLLLAVAISLSNAAAETKPAPPTDVKRRVDCFGDLLPAGAMARLGTVRFRQGNTIHAVAISPDGKTIASAGYPKTIHLWDTATGQRIGRLEGSESWIYSLAFLPDGKTLVSSGDDQSIRFWDVATGKQIRRLDKAGSRLAIAPDGKTMACVDYLSVIRIWDVASGMQLHQLQRLKGTIHTLAFSPDGETLAWGGGDDGNEILLGLVAVATGKELRRCHGKGNDVQSLAFSPDGKTLASAGNRQALRRWEVATGKELSRLGEPQAYLGAVIFAPDGKTLISGHNDGSITVWETASGKEIRRWRADHNGFILLALAADGRTLVAGGHAGLVRLWDVHTGKELGPVVGKQAKIERWAFSADGKTLVSLCPDGALRHWDAVTGNEARFLPGPRGWNRASFAPGGSELASMGPDGVIRFWQTSTGTELRRFTAQQDIDHEMSFSPNGNTLVTGFWGRKLRLVDAFSGKERGHLVDGASHFQIGAFSPDAKLLITSHWRLDPSDGTGSTFRIPPVTQVAFWNLSTGKKLHAIEGKWDWGLLLNISPDGKMLALVETDGAISLWETATKKERWRSGAPGSEQKQRFLHAPFFTFSPDGKLMLIGNQSDRLFPRETATGKVLPPVVVHDGPVQGVGFSPDGKILAALGKDGTIVTWDAAHIARRLASTARELSARERDSLWADLAGEDAPRAWKAIGALASAPKSAVAFLKERMAPAPAPDARKIDKMIADLDSGQFQKRAHAIHDLEGLGEVAEAVLRKALENKPPLESARRIETLLVKLEMQILPADTLRGLRALEALETIGTPAARQELDRLAGGASAALLTREAQASLQRLAKRPATAP